MHLDLGQPLRWIFEVVSVEAVLPGTYRTRMLLTDLSALLCHRYLYPLVTLDLQ